MTGTILASYRLKAVAMVLSAEWLRKFLRTSTLLFFLSFRLYSSETENSEDFEVTVFRLGNPPQEFSIETSSGMKFRFHLEHRKEGTSRYKITASTSGFLENIPDPFKPPLFVLKSYQLGFFESEARVRFISDVSHWATNGTLPEMTDFVINIEEALKDGSLPGSFRGISELGFSVGVYLSLTAPLVGLAGYRLQFGPVRLWPSPAISLSVLSLTLVAYNYRDRWPSRFQTFANRILYGRSTATEIERFARGMAVGAAAITCPQILAGLAEWGINYFR